MPANAYPHAGDARHSKSEVTASKNPGPRNIPSGLIDDARTAAQGDFGAGPAIECCREGGAGEEEVVHACQVLVEVRAGESQWSIEWAWWGVGPDS